jgi:nucleotide-binding universal stress UspA family protein
MYERIVVPLDGTPFGEYGIRYATAIALRSGAALELVHVHVPAHLEPELFEVPVFHYTGVVHRDAEYDYEHLTQEREQLERVALKLAERTGLRVTARVAVGTVDRTLEREAEAFGADLIVMSTHARTGLDRVRFGSVGDSVVRHATVPVLLVHPPDHASDVEPMAEFRRILVPLDGTEFSEQVLRAAGRLAALFGAHLHLLHVQAPPSLRTFVREMEGEDGNVTTVQLTAEQYLQYVAAEMAPDVDTPTLEVTMAKSAIAGILDAVHGSTPDIIAMATHGRGGLKRMLVGSTAGDVLYNAGVPVLLFRPQASGVLGSTAGSLSAGHTVI